MLWLLFNSGGGGAGDNAKTLTNSIFGAVASALGLSYLAKFFPIFGFNDSNTSNHPLTPKPFHPPKQVRLSPNPETDTGAQPTLPMAKKSKQSSKSDDVVSAHAASNKRESRSQQMRVSNEKIVISGSDGVRVPVAGPDAKVSQHDRLRCNDESTSEPATANIASEQQTKTARKISNGVSSMENESADGRDSKINSSGKKPKPAQVESDDEEDKKPGREIEEESSTKNRKSSSKKKESKSADKGKKKSKDTESAEKQNSESVDKGSKKRRDHSVKDKSRSKKYKKDPAEKPNKRKESDSEEEGEGESGAIPETKPKKLKVEHKADPVDESPEMEDEDVEMEDVSDKPAAAPEDNKRKDVEVKDKSSSKKRKMDKDDSKPAEKESRRQKAKRKMDNASLPDRFDKSGIWQEYEEDSEIVIPSKPEEAKPDAPAAGKADEKPNTPGTETKPEKKSEPATNSKPAEQNTNSSASKPEKKAGASIPNKGKEKEEDDEHVPTGKPAHRFIVFIGNLPYTTTVESLTKHLESLKPTSVRVPTDKKNPKIAKGFAFVEFKDASRMKSCLKIFHHSEFEGRKINVELTAGGGGSNASRKRKLADKNEKLNAERKRRFEEEEAEREEKRNRVQEQKESEPAVHPSRAKRFKK